MRPVSERIRFAIRNAGLSYGELSGLTGIPKAALQRYATGSTVKVPVERIEAIARCTGVTPAYLLGWDGPDAVFPVGENVYRIPLYESVSAGPGAFAVNRAVGSVPLEIPTPAEAKETVCLKVSGDSMYPKIEDGDVIQVHRQDSVDSGTIAIVLLDGEEGVVKRIEYGKDRIELHSVNPMYPIRRFEGPEMQRVRIFGAVKKIIKITG